MLKSTNEGGRNLLGVAPGMGKALGSEKRAYDVVQQVGNHGESYESNLGEGALWTKGGGLYVPPIR
jgi:hypothetical protein